MYRTRLPREIVAIVDRKCHEIAFGEVMAELLRYRIAEKYLSVLREFVKVFRVLSVLRHPSVFVDEWGMPYNGMRIYVSSMVVSENR